jgi:hypothetical protein
MEAEKPEAYFGMGPGRLSAAAVATSVRKVRAARPRDVARIRTRAVKRMRNSFSPGQWVRGKCR